MTKEDKQRVIGKVVAINSDRFSVELLSGLDNFNVSGFDDIHYFAQLNSYVIVPYQNYYIVAEVSGVREKDLNVPFSNPTDQILSKIQAGKFLEVLPIGTIKTNKANEFNFEFGVSVYPTLYSDVLYIKEQELDTIFKTNKIKEKSCQNIEECQNGSCQCKEKYTSLPIGKSTIFPDYDVKIDIDKFFGSHSAVLGNTGSGKSCTIASMLQTLYKFDEYSATGSTFIFFDVNGEYRQAFEKVQENNENIDVKNFTIDKVDEKDKTVQQFILPHWFLNIDEWALLLKASEKSQLPILRNALGFTQNLLPEVLRHIYACSIMYVYENWDSPVAKRQRVISLLGKANFNPNIDFSSYTQYGNWNGNGTEEIFKTAVRSFINPDIEIDPKYNSEKFNFNELGQAIENAILYEEYHGNKQIRDYCSSMLTRFKSIKERDDFSFLTKSNTDLDSSTYLRQFLGIENNKKKSQVIIIDLNSANDETVEVISCVLSRLIFEKLKTAKHRNTFPVNLVLEEAHRYISTDSGKVFGDANRIFERIAKEGRKYGMFLLVSSQRPSELSRTVLSQCSNFIVHRIQNPEDLSHIRQITPHISETILRRLPSIPTQHALIFGHAVNLPTTFKVNEADPKPKSDNNEVSKNWFKEKGFDIDL
ncbi:ATP-binding protein [Epilithonimonas hominis]|uniref:ATP-binding protein n=1 Tax=Epilithonimonas hominis TaxID=420404 RepID=UPI00289925B0|nr:ATP-binding protein [Epilithonimonas hominis]